jgi:hypothetical protein
MSQPTTNLFPTPPPTLNNLEPHERTRLLRSTRKLESLLGTTPFLLEHADIMVSTHTAKAHRREGRIFGSPLPLPPSPSYSHSSKTTPDSDGSFVFVTGPSSLEHTLPPFELTLAMDEVSLFAKKQKTSKKRETSKDRCRPTKSKAKSKARTKKGTPPSPLPHPLVLCLRSVPDARLAPGHVRPSLFAICSPSHSKSRPTAQPNLHVPSTPTTPTTQAPLTPLSPLSPAFYSSNHSEFGSELEREKEHDQRRKKFAKLTRTLGENVPPELVFPASVQAPFLNTKDNENTAVRKPSDVLHPKSAMTHKSKAYPKTDTLTRNKSHSHIQSTSTLTSSSPPPPPYSTSALPSSALLEPFSSRHQEEKQADAEPTTTIPKRKHKHRPHSRSLSVGSGVDMSERHGETAGEMRSEGTSSSAGRRREEEGTATPKAQIQAQCPPSLAVLFRPCSNLETDADTCSRASHTTTRAERVQHQHKTHRHAHSSPSPSPVEAGASGSDVLSNPNESRSPTPAPAPTRPPTPLSRLPSLLKPSASKSHSGIGAKAPKSHSAKSKSLGLAGEVYGAGFATGRGNEDWEELTRARAGTPNPLPSRSGTPHPIPSRSGTPHPQECGRRKENGWSGEWNRGDMEEVVKALRDLKAR